MAQPVGKAFEELIHLLERLRAPDGCPWDREQTHESLKRNLLEETYEVLEAIDRKGDGLAEELGDVLLQILFHAQIGREQGAFDMAEVMESIHAKLVRRHPHVFGDATVRDAQEVEENWARLKHQEAPRRSLLEGVPQKLPGLAASQLLQDRASRAGFDWPDMEGVLEKVVEEIREIQAADSPEERSRELGDLLLVLVNVGRWLGVHAEDALRGANARFSRRFAAMERLCQERGFSFADLSLEAKEALWQEVKAS